MIMCQTIPSREHEFVVGAGKNGKRLVIRFEEKTGVRAFYAYFKEVVSQ